MTGSVVSLRGLPLHWPFLRLRLLFVSPYFYRFLRSRGSPLLPRRIVVSSELRPALSATIPLLANCFSLRYFDRGIFYAPLADGSGNVLAEDPGHRRDYLRVFHFFPVSLLRFLGSCLFLGTKRVRRSATRMKFYIS